MGDYIDLGIVVTQGKARKYYVHKVKYRCKTCGIWVEAQKNAYDKHGRRNCKKCTSLSNGDLIAKTHKEKAKDTFAKKVDLKFNGQIDCSNSEYIDQYTEVTAFCKVHNAYFNRTPRSILRGYACPDCSAARKDYNKRKNLSDPAILYYIHFKEFNLWKLGVTTTTLSRRYSAEPSDFIIVFTTPVISAESAYRLEYYLLSRYKIFKYVGENMLQSGNTECFTEDISKALLLDIEEYLHQNNSKEN